MALRVAGDMLFAAVYTFRLEIRFNEIGAVDGNLSFCTLKTEFLTASILDDIFLFVVLFPLDYCVDTSDNIGDDLDICFCQKSAQIGVIYSLGLNLRILFRPEFDQMLERFLGIAPP